MSYLLSMGWLLSPVEISIELDPLHSLGEVKDEGQGGVDGVDAEAFVVPDWCYTGRARAYNRLGGRVAGRVVMRTVHIGARVWHEGLQLQLQQYLHLMDPYIMSEQVTVSFPLLPSGEGGWITDVPTSVPFSLPLVEGSGWADTYNGYTFGIRHILSAVLQRPWYTFNCPAYEALWFYSVGPGHENTRSCEPVEALPSEDGPPAAGSVTRSTLEASVLVRGGACAVEDAKSIPCTQCTVSLPSDHLATSGSLECTISFRSVAAHPPTSDEGRDDKRTDERLGQTTPRTPTTDCPFVPIQLVQLVLIRGEFSGDCCLHMHTALVHTAVGLGDATNESLAATTALSRGYSTRSGSSGAAREQDPINEDTVISLEIPLRYVAPRDPTGLSGAPASVRDGSPAPTGAGPALTSEQKEKLAGRSGTPSAAYSLLGDPELWRAMRVDPSLHIQRLPGRSRTPSCIAGLTAEDVAERVLADDTVLDNEVAVRYFLRLIVQDGEGETFFVTSKELILFRDGPPEVLSEGVPRAGSSSVGGPAAGSAGNPSYNNEHAMNL